jgi:hypothetical protein
MALHADLQLALRRLAPQSSIFHQALYSLCPSRQGLVPSRRRPLQTRTLNAVASINPARADYRACQSQSLISPAGIMTTFQSTPQLPVFPVALSLNSLAEKKSGFESSSPLYSVPWPRPSVLVRGAWGGDHGRSRRPGGRERRPSREGGRSSPPPSARRSPRRGPARQSSAPRRVSRMNGVGG